MGDFTTDDEQVRSLVSKLLGDHPCDDQTVRRRVTGAKSGSQQQSAALGAVLNRFKRFAEDTRDAIDNSVCFSATTIANDHKADVAWLFIKRERGIEAIFAHKNRDRDEFLRFDEPSLAGYVAQSGIPIAAPDVSAPDVPAYRPFPEMRSAISVPLKTSSGEILGVFHLESRDYGEYNDAHIPRLHDEAAKLIPFLLMLRAVERADDRWFPWRSFDLTTQLSMLCNDIRRELDHAGIQCLIGCADHSHKFIYVFATTGHLSECMYCKTVPFESFNGDLLRLPPNLAGTIRPGEKTQIETGNVHGIEIEEGHFPSVDNWKGSFSKWRMSLGCPLYVRMPREENAHAQGTIVLSCFDKDSEQALPPPEELSQIAEEVGEFITGYLSLSEELAGIYLQQALQSCRKTEDAFEAIVQKYTEFFGLDAIAIDGYLKGEEKASVLTRGGFGLAVELARAAHNPFQVFRPDVFNKKGKQIGRFHLIRSQPFAVSDCELAYRLAAMCASTFEKWQAEEAITGAGVV